MSSPNIYRQARLSRLIGQLDVACCREVNEDGGMDFEKSGNYRLTISRDGYPGAAEMDVRYDGPEQHDGEEVHYFEGPGRFYLGIPEHLIGSEFRIEPV